MNRFHRYCFVFLLFITSIFTLSGQCEPTSCGDSHGMIKDNSVNYFPIHISAAQNNDLADINQGLLRVYIDFTHLFISQLEATLIAPSGDEVQLMGKADQSGGNTNLSKWKVCFVAKSILAIPDDGFSDIWANGNDWELLHTYKGSYYPYNGEFSDFTGSVNGDWVLRIEDKYFINDGKINNFSIEFKDDTGINCSSCGADAGEILVSSDTLCYGESTGDGYVTVDFQDDSPDSLYYGYKYLVVYNDTIIESDTLVNLSDNDAGMYKVLGFSYALYNATSDFVGISLDSLILLISENAICGSISDTQVVTILDLSDETIIDIELCSDDTYEYDGIVYDTAGVYYIHESTEFCNDVTILNISLFNQGVEIYSIGNNVLDCDFSVVLLSITPHSRPSDEGYWFTQEGHFNSSTIDSDTVVVNRAGRYYYRWTNGECEDTVSYAVLEDGMQSKTMITTETISCDSIKISYSSNKELESVEWILPDGSVYTNIGFDFETKYFYSTLEGWISLNSIDEDGCIGKSNVFLEFDIFDPYELNASEIDCNNDTSIIQSSPLEQGVGYSWYDDEGELISDTSFAKVSEAGIYYIYMKKENCENIDSIEVIDTGVYPELIGYTVDSLSCEIDSVMIVTEYDQSGLSYHWIGDFGFESNENNPFVKNVGVYYLTVVNSDSCSAIDTFYVYAKDDKPVITVGSNTILCGVDSIKLDVEISSGNYSYEWTGPHDFYSIELHPFVSFPGVYEFTVLSLGSCTSRAEVIVSQQGSNLNVSLHSDTLSCYTEAVDITTVIEGEYSSVEWTGPHEFASSSISLSSLEYGGWYYVTILDTDKCIVYDSIEVYSDTLAPVAIAGSDQSINCVGDPLQLDGQGSMVNDDVSILWQSEGTSTIDDSQTLTPTVYSEDYYYLELFNNANGCSDRDTIYVSDSSDPWIDLGNDTIVVPGAIIPIGFSSNIANNNIVETHWTFNESEPCNLCYAYDMNVFESGELSLTIIDDGGCTATDSRFIRMADIEDVYIPTVFSNEDKNLNFSISCTSNVSFVNNVFIFDRWGGLLFEKSNYSPTNDTFSWDGTYMGEEVQPTVLMVVVEYVCQDGTEKHQIGTTLITR